MARSLSHLTGYELAALAAPYENPNHRSQRGKNRKITYPELPADFRQKLAATGKDEIKALARQVKNTLPGEFDFSGGDVEAFVFGFFLQYKGRPITDKELTRFYSPEWYEFTPPKKMSLKAHRRSALDSKMIEAARYHARVVLYGKEEYDRQEEYDRLWSEREIEDLYWEYDRL